MSNFDVRLKNVEPQLVASVPETIPDWEQVSPTFNRLFDEVIGYAAQHGGHLADAPFDRWLDAEFMCGGTPQTGLRVEACAPIRNAIPPSDRVQVYEMEGTETMAFTVLHGPFTLIKQAHEAVIRWAEANGRRICGPSREVYLQYERDGDPDAYVTEVQYPVTSA